MSSRAVPSPATFQRRSCSMPGPISSSSAIPSAAPCMARATPMSAPRLKRHRVPASMSSFASARPRQSAIRARPRRWSPPSWTVRCRRARALPRLSVAYEPVWAIGTGRVPSVDDVAAMHAAIRQSWLRSMARTGRACAFSMAARSMRAMPADLLAVAEVGGALVGGASLTAESFTAIIGAAGALLDD
jgi:hypothetical protein